MKRLLMLMVVCVMFLVGCGTKVPTAPQSEVVKSDVQEYITELIDRDAIITYFLEADTNTTEDEYKVTCAVAYQSLITEYRDEFVLTYTIQDKEWKLSKCRVNSDYSGKYKGDLGDNAEEKQDSSSLVTATSTPTPTSISTSEPTATPTSTPTPEPTATPTSTPTPEPTATPVTMPPVSMSDELFDYTFELNGTYYQLPMTYQAFVECGWELVRGESEETKLNGYSYSSVRFLNDGKTMYVDVVNMGGHARAIKDCIIGGMTIRSNEEDSFVMAKNISFDSTMEEIKEAFGIPDTDYTSSITYDEGSRYKKVQFGFYNGNLSDVTFQCFEAIGEDVTVVSEERPEYLDEYLAPTELGTDMTDTVLELGGVIYRLPCPLSEFLSNGWKIASKNINSLGAGNSESTAIKIEKDGVKLEVGLKNFSEKEVYIDNCSVYRISFASYDFKNVEKDFGKLPNGITLLSSEDEIAMLCKDFEKSDSTYSMSYTYQDYYYTKEIKIWLSKDSSDSSITVKNTEWDY